MFTRHFMVHTPGPLSPPLREEDAIPPDGVVMYATDAPIMVLRRFSDRRYAEDEGNRLKVPLYYVGTNGRFKCFECKRPHNWGRTSHGARCVAIRCVCGSIIINQG